MAKSFAPRVSKKQRKIVDLSEKLNKDLFKMSDDKLLQGAKLTEISLKDIIVKDQVRTKFNDDSIRDLADNIKVNGLIQPLVLHRHGTGYTLICGERRFRAMSFINMEKCPCFVLQNKTSEELMAIQFSENSSRENLHYIDKADGILSYQKATKDSERKIQAALGISKSEVHRSLLIAKMSDAIKEKAKTYDIEKYVLLEWDAMDESPIKKSIYTAILAGEITKRVELKRMIKNQGVISTGKKKTNLKSLPPGMSANAFIKAMQSKSNSLKLDKDTKKLLKSLVDETRDMMAD